MTPVAMSDTQMELPMAALLKRRFGERTMPGGRQAYGRVRADSLPEHTRYRDDGCEVNPSCLTCPLPRCRYEEPGGLRGLINGYRDRQIVELRLQGAPVHEIAERFALSRRTVFRILETSSRNARGEVFAGRRLEVQCA